MAVEILKFEPLSGYRMFFFGLHKGVFYRMHGIFYMNAFVPFGWIHVRSYSCTSAQIGGFHDRCSGDFFQLRQSWLSV